MPLHEERRHRSLGRSTVGLAVGFGIALWLAPVLAAAVLFVDYPWARPAGKGGTTEVFMEITSVEGGTLVAARSGIAEVVAIVGPGARGKPVAGVALPPAAPVLLAPGSYRLRLERIGRRVELGNAVPLVLIVEAADGRREEIAIQAEVRRRSLIEDHLSGHRH